MGHARAVKQTREIVMLAVSAVVIAFASAQPALELPLSKLERACTERVPVGEIESAARDVTSAVAGRWGVAWPRVCAIIGRKDCSWDVRVGLLRSVIGSCDPSTAPRLHELMVGLAGRDTKEDEWAPLLAREYAVAICDKGWSGWRSDAVGTANGLVEIAPKTLSYPPGPTTAARALVDAPLEAGDKSRLARKLIATIAGPGAEVEILGDLLDARDVGEIVSELTAARDRGEPAAFPALQALAHRGEKAIEPLLRQYRADFERDNVPQLVSAIDRLLWRIKVQESSETLLAFVSSMEQMNDQAARPWAIDRLLLRGVDRARVVAAAEGHKAAVLGKKNPEATVAEIRVAWALREALVARGLLGPEAWKDEFTARAKEMRARDQKTGRGK